MLSLVQAGTTEDAQAFGRFIPDRLYVGAGTALCVPSHEQPQLGWRFVDISRARAMLCWKVMLADSENPAEDLTLPGSPESPPALGAGCQGAGCLQQHAQSRGAGRGWPREVWSLLCSERRTRLDTSSGLQ